MVIETDPEVRGVAGRGRLQIAMNTNHDTVLDPSLSTSYNHSTTNKAQNKQKAPKYNAPPRGSQ